MNMHKRTQIAAFAIAWIPTCLLYVTPSWGTLIVMPGDHDLAPNMPGQTIEIRLQRTDADTLLGMNLNIQLGDGFPPGLPITNVDIVGPGTLFTADNNGQAGGPATTEIWTGVGTLAAGPVSLVAPEVTLAIVTIDTTGFFSGSFPLRLLGTLNGDSSILGASADVQFSDSVGLGSGVGQVTVIPEPASGVLAMLGFSLFAVMACRRRRK